MEDTHRLQYEDRFRHTFETMCNLIHEDNVQKGFWEYGKDRSKGELVALMHTELSEMFEGIREGNPPDKHCSNFTSEEIELADLFIRAMDYASAFRLRMGEAILAKLAFNRTRPHKHNKMF